MDLRYKITPIPGAVSIPFTEDFKLEVAFLDSSTGQTIVDHTGSNAILMSTLLASMPPDVLEQFVIEVGARMAAIAGGIGS